MNNNSLILLLWSSPNEHLTSAGATIKNKGEIIMSNYFENDPNALCYGTIMYKKMTPALPVSVLTQMILKGEIDSFTIYDSDGYFEEWEKIFTQIYDCGIIPESIYGINFIPKEDSYYTNDQFFCSLEHSRSKRGALLISEYIHELGSSNIVTFY